MRVSLAGWRLARRRCRRIAFSVGAAVSMCWSETVQSGSDVPRAVMAAPFEAQRANFFYSAVGVPRMQSAVPMEAGRARIRVRTDHAESLSGPNYGGDFVQAEYAAGRPIKDGFRGQYHTWLALEGAVGMNSGLELAGRIGIVGWDEHGDHFYFFDEQGRPLVRHEEEDIGGRGASGRDDDLELALRGKARVWEKASGDGLRNCLALGATVKFPVGSSRNLVDAGTTDIGVGILDSVEWGDIVLHANVWGVAPVGKQTLFHDYGGVDLDPFVAWGVGGVWRLAAAWSVGVQIEGNTSAFDDIAFLDKSPVTVLGALRTAHGPWILECGGATGLDHDAAYRWAGFLSAGRMFP